MNKEQYTIEACASISIAKYISNTCGHSYIGTEHLLYGLIKEPDGTAGMILRECGLDCDKVLKMIQDLIAPPSSVAVLDKKHYSLRAEKVLQAAVSEASMRGLSVAGTEHILLSLIKDSESVAARLLHTLGMNMQKLYAMVLAAMGEEIDPNAQITNLAADRDADTPNLNQYSRDLTLLAKEGRLDPVIGREDEINRILQILSRRTKNNPCLIGEPGVGKTAIIEGLAQRISEGLVPTAMQDKRLVMLDLTGMIAGTKYRGEFEERIKNVIGEVSASNNILLFIDEIHTIIGAGGAEGALDAANILKPALSRGEIQIIGATTISEYRKHIEKDAALERRFQSLMVEEPSERQTFEILKGLRPYYESHHDIEIKDEALQAAISMSIRYINDRFLPDKAIDLIDEAASRVRLTGYVVPQKLQELEKAVAELTIQEEEAIIAGDFEAASAVRETLKKADQKLQSGKNRILKKRQKEKLQVTAEDIAKTVAAWTKIPLAKIAEEESKRLARLESILHKRVIGQDEAVTAVSKAIRRGRVGLKDPKRPVGSFLFLGPTGVGKTELSKALAEAVFGSEQAMIRVDMSEYMEKHSVSKLIGSPPGYVGYEEGGQLSEKVRRNPYSVLLFDEIEKAHPDVFNILLQVLDDGHITDSQGRKIDFKQTCIIMTSNAGAQNIITPKKLGFITDQSKDRDYSTMKSQVMEEIKRLFKPEFLNRIDDIIVFKSLDKEDMKAIITIMLKDLEKRCKEQMDITLRVSPKAKEKIIDDSYDQKYGARPLRRAIQNLIENPLSEELLIGSIKRGDLVSIGVSQNRITIKQG